MKDGDLDKKFPKTVFKSINNSIMTTQVCPGLNANGIQIPYDKHLKVSSLVKSHQDTPNSVKSEVI